MPQFNDAVTAFQFILQAFGAIAIIGGGWKYIADMMKPHKELEQRVEKIESNQNKDYKRLHKMEQIQNAQSILLIEIANHLITGNDKEKLKRKADDLFECITRSEEQ